MDVCDVLIVGAGPAGRSGAWKLRDSGLRVVILDRQSFPRDKVCGGWITPPVVEELEIDLEEYSGGHVLQNIHGFRTSRMGSREVETDYGRPISYGIRRCEFDDFLLKRCRAHSQKRSSYPPGTIGRSLDYQRPVQGPTGDRRRGAFLSRRPIAGSQRSQ